ncbi:lysosomal integral membrane protein II [Tieghemostelium lacteum]|uniref:Lysosomal integral membrane protein II n=1 Tax=Tieghemostelium lacteum TaxID=361077 RepID=A0A152A5S7_TIELA|nr:lysosomal integral membrane protein II [Tieghemostelium lacteum]|eukprot:KYR01451.1 lysosomal integral membrane protein II [Tieghemostelium lacteum]
MARIKRGRLFISLPIGLVLVAVGIIVWFTVDTAIHNQLENASITLPENDKSDLVNPWTRFVGNQNDTNNRRLYVYYVYNLTNPDEVTQGAYPVFEEVGPYHYNYIYERIIGNITDDENVVTFQMWKRFIPILDAPNTRNPLTDQIYHFNLAYAAIVKSSGSELNLGLSLGSGSVGQVITTLNSPTFQLTAGSPAIPNVFTLIIGSMPADATPYTNWIGPINGYGSVPANYSVYNFGITTNDVDMSQFVSLMDSSFPLSFRNPNPTTTGFMVWLQALTNQTVKASLKQAITTSVGISGDTFEKLFLYYANFRTTVAIPKMLSLNPNCASVTCTQSDMGYLQWGTASGLLGGQSVKSLQPTLPGIPEFGISQNYTLSLAAIKRLFLPTSVINIVTPKGIGTLFALTASQNSTSIAGASGLTLTLADCVKITTYMQYMIKDFTWPTIKAQNGGPFQQHSVNDFMFNSQDPILKILFPNNPEEWNSSPLKNITTYDLAAEELPVDSTYTGKNDSQLSQVPITYHGHDTVQYAVPIKVEGHNSENIGPFFLVNSDVEDPPVTLFSEEYARSLFMEKESVGNFGGLHYYRYRMSESNWAVNETMFTGVDHLMNLTSSMGIPVYMSRPRLKGINVQYFTKAGLSDLYDVTEDNDVYGDYEPNTGKAIRGRYSLQVNYYVEGENDETSSIFNYFSNLKSDVVYPMVWGKNEVAATQDQIDLIKTSYSVDAFRYALTIILIVIGSFLVLCSTGLYLVDLLIEKGYFTD